MTDSASGIPGSPITRRPARPAGRDLIRPLVEAMRAEGLRVGLYHSLLDWHHPDYTIDKYHPMRDDGRSSRRRRAGTSTQVRRLPLRSGPGAPDRIRHDRRLFFDYSFPGPGGKGRNEWQSEQLLKMIRELQPGIIVNDRLDLLDVPGGWDYRTPEQFMPREWVSVDGRPVPWETCQTFSGFLGLRPGRVDLEIVRPAHRHAHRDGQQGRQPPSQRRPDRRAGLSTTGPRTGSAGSGEWMSKNGRSIYGCTQAPAEFPSRRTAS